MDKLSKNLLKKLSTYKRSSFCDDEGVFVVEGVKMCDEALLSGYEIVTICAVHDWWTADKQALSNRYSCFEITDDELNRITCLKTPNQVWMLLKRPSFSIECINSNNWGIKALVLDRIQDPGNLGTIIRTADWFGIRNIVCGEGTVSCYNSKVLQATMGGIFRTSIVYTSIDKYIQAEFESGTPIYGALLAGENVYYAPIQSNAILLIGNESKGISNSLLPFITQPITIPNPGGTCESLNAAIATSILCSEMYRALNCNS